MKKALADGAISVNAYERAYAVAADASAHDGWFEPTVETWKQALGDIGFDGADIRFSGFGCQGDGASFTCSIDIRRIILFLADPPAPRDAILPREGGGEDFWPWISHKAGGVGRQDFMHLMPVAMDGNMEGTVRRISGHYFHENTVEADIEVHGHYEIGEYSEIVDHSQDLLSFIESLRLDLCRAIYRDLRDEHDYLASEEAVMECAVANDFHFDERGYLA